MAWHRPGDKPLSEPMMVSLLKHICVTRPQWVKFTSMFYCCHWSVFRTMASGYTHQFWVIAWMVRTLLWGQGRTFVTLLAMWPSPKVNNMAVKQLFHEHNLILQSLKGIASTVFVEGWKVFLSEQLHNWRDLTSTVVDPWEQLHLGIPVVFCFALVLASLFHSVYPPFSELLQPCDCPRASARDETTKNIGHMDPLTIDNMTTTKTKHM